MKVALASVGFVHTRKEGTKRFTQNRGGLRRIFTEGTGQEVPNRKVMVIAEQGIKTIIKKI